MNSEQKIQNIFRSYYEEAIGGSDPNKHLVLPKKTEQREFGVGDFEKKIAYRHIAFSGEKELSAFLINRAPLYISHSTAYYRYPEKRPMFAKEYLGSDLVFDLDSGDVGPCGNPHDEDWVCGKCLGNVRLETQKLIRLLTEDLGFSEKELAVYFSGQKGYHVHIRSEEVRSLDQEARKQIVEYVTATGLSVNKNFLVEKQHGWAEKIRKQITDYLGGKTQLPHVKSEKLYEKLGKLSTPKDYFKVDLKNTHIQKIIQHTKQTWAAKIDAQVTYDLSKLIRMPGSLHGSTGLKVQRVNDIHSFDPMNEAVVFGEEPTKIRVSKKTPLFEIRNQKIGPLEPGETKLPLHAAIFLVLKKRGDFVGL